MKCQQLTGDLKRLKIFRTLSRVETRFLPFVEIPIKCSSLCNKLKHSRGSKMQSSDSMLNWIENEKICGLWQILQSKWTETVIWRLQLSDTATSYNKSLKIQRFRYKPARLTFYQQFCWTTFGLFTHSLASFCFSNGSTLVNPWIVQICVRYSEWSIASYCKSRLSVRPYCSVIMLPLVGDFSVRWNATGEGNLTSFLDRLGSWVLEKLEIWFWYFERRDCKRDS